VTRCGFRCDLCPVFRENVSGSEYRKRVIDGWFEYFGFRIPPEEICCDGCRDERPDSKQLDTKCEIRRCAIRRGMETCAHCPDFGCETMKTRQVSRQWVEERFGGPIPEEDYRSFVLQYESGPRLEEIRRELRL